MPGFSDYIWVVCEWWSLDVQLGRMPILGTCNSLGRAMGAPSRIKRVLVLFVFSPWTPGDEGLLPVCLNASSTYVNIGGKHCQKPGNHCHRFTSGRSSYSYHSIYGFFCITSTFFYVYKIT